MGYLELPQATFFLEEQGQGPPLLVPKGCDRTFAGLADVVPILAERYRVIFFADTESDQLLAKGQYDRLVEGWGWVMDALGISRAALVAGCFAANLALDFVSRHPQRVEAVLLADPMAFAHADVQRLPPDFPSPFQPQRPGEWSHVGAMAFPDGKEWLRRLPVPAVMVYGDQDPVSSLPGFAAEVGVNPKITLLRWPGIRHMGLYEPEEFAGVILEFFQHPHRPIQRVWSHLRSPGLPPGARNWC